jgi:hypothetical protein
MGYKTTKSIKLSNYLSDSEGGPIIYSGSYSFVGSGGGAASPAVTIPGGVISWSPADTLLITSTSQVDIGTYTFTIKASDEQPLSSTTSFTLTISNTNTIPKLVSTAPPDISVVHKYSISINLASYFVDDQGDPMTMTATYSYNGGASISIPGGIFAKPS